MRGYNNKYIIETQSRVFRYTNDTCQDIASIYNYLHDNIECTYLIYMYENLALNEKYVYSSNWNWQNLLIGEKLINYCPIFKIAFNCLEKRNQRTVFVPWCDAPPGNPRERDVCGIRSEHNIANGFGYGAKGFGIRESLAFGGGANDKYFYQHFTRNKILFNRVLNSARNAILLRNHIEKKLIFKDVEALQ